MRFDRFARLERHPPNSPEGPHADCSPCQRDCAVRRPSQPAGERTPHVVEPLAAAGAVHLARELLFVAASYGLSVSLTPRGAAGRYQAMFATGQAAAQAVIMTAVVLEWGQLGWLALGALFPLAVAPAPTIGRWAMRSRSGRLGTVTPEPRCG